MGQQPANVTGRGTMLVDRRHQPMVSSSKILLHQDRVAAFLRGEPIAPVTLELGLTAACNRRCPDCPSSLGASSLTLPPPLVDRLLAHLGGRTRGLIVTGGEPTIAEHFGATLAQARRQGFTEIAVVSNGSTLDHPEVVRPLLDHASVVRISLYDWNDGALARTAPTLRRIAGLRRRIDATGSPLLIGTSALTSEAALPDLPGLVAAVADAGAHFIYFHPTCVRDLSGGAEQRAQARVLEQVEAWRRNPPGGLSIHVLEDRYSKIAVRFSAYHAAHFILVLAADGCVYLATEAKYQPRYRLWNLAEDWRDDFIEQPRFLAGIAAVASETFAPGGSRNRGLLYSSLLQRLRDGTLDPEAAAGTPGPFLLPHII